MLVEDKTKNNGYSDYGKSPPQVPNRFWLTPVFLFNIKIKLFRKGITLSVSSQ